MNHFNHLRLFNNQNSTTTKTHRVPPYPFSYPIASYRFITHLTMINSLVECAPAWQEIPSLSRATILEGHKDLEIKRKDLPGSYPERALQTPSPTLR